MPNFDFLRNISFVAVAALGFLIGWMASPPLNAANVTIAAIVVGPVVAVLITRLLDDRRARRLRRWDIFRNLMCYRSTPLNVEFVGALNLLEVEFANDKPVIEAWKKLLLAFDKPVPPDGSPTLETLTRERIETTTRLLDAVAKSLGLRIEQLDIQSGGYSPKGWADAENEQTIIRRFFADMASNKRALNVVVWPARKSDEGRQPPPQQER